ncbi:hypothetical protein SAMN05444745_103319 [Arthrobacter sp. OV608]|nr:hypothetical protein SAMN05444745_103319 [Arthrobacter sp. OV608]
MPHAKSRRLEVRTHESTDALITEAAELLHMAKSDDERTVFPHRRANPGYGLGLLTAVS